MSILVFHYPGNEAIAAELCKHPSFEEGKAVWGVFPDGESKLLLQSSVAEKSIVLVCSLNKPDEKLTRLYLFCNLLRSSGAKHIALLAPYLCYMRQDKVFKTGEGVTAAYSAQLISSFVDEIITVDAHLHRIQKLSEVYSVPAYNLHAALEIARYIKTTINDPVLIGPDSESEQWVMEVASAVGCEFTVLEKVRYGDRDVKIQMKNAAVLSGKNCVLVDDIISTGRTLIETLKHLKELGLGGAHCLAVHAVFADNSYQQLQDAGALSIVTCNTIPHPSNGISLAEVYIKHFLQNS